MTWNLGRFGDMALPARHDLKSKVSSFDKWRGLAGVRTAMTWGE